MTDIIIFAAALFVMVIIVLVRYIEIKKHKNIISESLRDKCDHYVILFFKKANFLGRRLRAIVVYSGKYITHIISQAIVQSWEFFVKKTAKYINIVRGKGIIKHKKGFSFFMNIMSEEQRKRME